MLVFCQTDVHDVRTEARVFAMHWCWHSHVPSCPFLLQAWQECREPQTAMFATSQQNCMALGSGFRTKMFGTSKNITRWLVLLQKQNTRVGFFFSGASGSVVALLFLKMTLQRFHLFNQQCRKTPSLNFPRTDFRWASCMTPVVW